MYHKSTGYKVFSFFNHLFLITLSLLCILPLLHVLAVSFSGKSQQPLISLTSGRWTSRWSRTRRRSTIPLLLERCFIPYTGPFSELRSAWLSSFLPAMRCPSVMPRSKAGIFTCGFSYLRCCSQADWSRAIF